MFRPINSRNYKYSPSNDSASYWLAQHERGRYGSKQRLEVDVCRSGNRAEVVDNDVPNPETKPRGDNPEEQQVAGNNRVQHAVERKRRVVENKEYGNGEQSVCKHLAGYENRAVLSAHALYYKLVNRPRQSPAQGQHVAQQFELHVLPVLNNHQCRTGKCYKRAGYEARRHFFAFSEPPGKQCREQWGGAYQQTYVAHAGVFQCRVFGKEIESSSRSPEHEHEQLVLEVVAP